MPNEDRKKLMRLVEIERSCAAAGQVMRCGNVPPELRGAIESWMIELRRESVALRETILDRMAGIEGETLAETPDDLQRKVLGRIAGNAEGETS